MKLVDSKKRKNSLGAVNSNLSPSRYNNLYSQTQQLVEKQNEKAGETDQLQGKVSNKESTINSLNKQIEKHKSDIEDAQSIRSSAKNYESKMEKALSDLKKLVNSSIASIRKDAKSLKSKVESALNDLRSIKNDMNGVISDRNQKISSKIQRRERLRAEVNNLHSRIRNLTGGGGGSALDPIRRIRNL